MKKFFLLLVVLFAIYLVTHRQRLFLRDPMATVLRAGARESGAQVFINYSNDVLIKNDNAPSYLFIVQQGGNIGTPQTLHCLQWVACQTDANAASLASAQPITDIKSMTNKRIEFTDSQGRDSVVTLR